MYVGLVVNLNSLFLIIKWLPAAGYIATSRPWSGGRLRGLLGRSKLILSLISLMGASVCSQSWTQTGLGGKLEQAQPPARNVCQWHGAVPVPLLGSGSGSLILHGPGSRAAGDARAYQNFTSRHDLPVYGLCGDRHPMRPPYGYFSNWAYARTRAK